MGGGGGCGGGGVGGGGGVAGGIGAGAGAGGAAGGGAAGAGGGLPPRMMSGANGHLPSSHHHQLSGAGPSMLGQESRRTSLGGIQGVGLQGL